MVTVVKPEEEGDNFEVVNEAYSGPGIIINSKFLNGLKAPNDAVLKAINIIEEKNLGKNKLTTD